MRLTGEGGRCDLLDRVVQAVCVDCFVILPRNDSCQPRWIKSGQGLNFGLFLFGCFFRMKENFIDFRARALRAGYQWTFRSLGVLALILVLRSSMFAGPVPLFLESGNISIEVDNTGVLQDVTFEGVSQGSNSSIEFFYRLGSDTEESPLISLNGPLPDTISIGNFGESSPDFIRLTGSIDSLFDYELRLTPFDSDTGDGLAFLDAALVISNVQGSLDFTIFGLINFDLDGSSGSDFSMADIDGNFQTDFPFQVNTFFQVEGVSGEPPTPEGTQTLFFIPNAFDLDAAPQIENSLTDNSITNFSGNASTSPTFGPGNASYGIQWDFTITGPSEEAELQVFNDFQVIPEPRTYAYLLVGLMAIYWCRKKAR